MNTRVPALLVALALIAVMVGCGSTDARHASPDVGPFSEAEGTGESLKLESLGQDLPYRLEVMNLHGGVSILSSDNTEARASLEFRDGKRPGAVYMTVKEGIHRIWVTDTGDARYSGRPEHAILMHDDSIERLGRKLPRVDLHLQVPSGTSVDVLSAAMLYVSADVNVAARISGQATLRNGSGVVSLSAPIVDARRCGYSVNAESSQRITMIGVSGDKFLRGPCDVEIRDGEGLVDVHVAGAVVARTTLSHGYGHTERTGAHSGMDYDRPIGPSFPFDQSDARAREKSRMYNRISGSYVDMRMSKTQRISVEIDVTHGALELGLPHNKTVVTRKVLDDAVDLQEHTASSAHFTLNHPVGELIVTARDGASVLVE